MVALAKELAEEDASIQTLTRRPAKDLAEVDGSIKTLTGMLAKDRPRRTPATRPSLG